MEHNSLSLTQSLPSKITLTSPASTPSPTSERMLTIPASPTTLCTTSTGHWRGRQNGTGRSCSWRSKIERRGQVHGYAEDSGQARLRDHGVGRGRGPARDRGDCGEGS